MSALPRLNTFDPRDSRLPNQNGLIGPKRVHKRMVYCRPESRLSGWTDWMRTHVLVKRQSGYSESDETTGQLKTRVQNWRPRTGSADALTTSHFQFSIVDPTENIPFSENSVLKILLTAGNSKPCQADLLSSLFPNALISAGISIIQTLQY